MRKASIALLATLLAAPPAVEPATIVVGAGCTLVDAIAAANTDAATGACTAGSGADELVLTAAVQLTAVYGTVDGEANGTPSITSNVTVRGNGFAIQRPAVSPAFRLLHVAAGASLTLDGVTVEGGAGDEGGAVKNRGTLALVNSTVSDNTARIGGGIHNLGDMTVSGSTLAGNVATVGGGAIINSGGSLTVADSALTGNASGHHGGGIYSNSVLVLTNTTVSNNDGGRSGGGIENAPFGQLTLAGSTISGNTVTFNGGGLQNVYYSFASITNSTFSGNTADLRGGGLNNFNARAVLANVTLSGNSSPNGGGISDSNPFYPAGYVALANTVVAQGSLGADCESDTGIVDGGNNLDDDGTCPVVGTITQLDPVLADNGGPTLTHALLAGSSAIDAAGDCGLATDQRGFSRDAACDGGAFEFDAATAPVGGSVTGLASQKRIACTNLTTGDSVTFTLSGPSSWDCEAHGLVVDPGDAVRMRIRGVVDPPSPDPVAGTVAGMTLSLVTCQNRTTGQTIQIPGGGQTSWDCEAAGLVVNGGDVILETPVGSAD